MTNHILPPQPHPADQHRVPAVLPPAGSPLPHRGRPQLPRATPRPRAALGPPQAHSCQQNFAKFSQYLAIAPIKGPSVLKAAASFSNNPQILREIVLMAGSRLRHDLYLKLVVTALDYSTEDTRQLLVRALTQATEPGRVYATRWLGVLARYTQTQIIKGSQSHYPAARQAGPDQHRRVRGGAAGQAGHGREPGGGQHGAGVR